MHHALTGGILRGNGCWIYQKSFFKYLKFIIKFDYFRGRWVGVLTRENDNTQHEFVMEIRQKASLIWIKTFSKRSSSYSLTSQILTDDSENDFSLGFYWQGQSGGIESISAPKGIFHGFTLVKLFENEKPKRLSGNYFTGRDPQTKGMIDLKFDSDILQEKLA